MTVYMYMYVIITISTAIMHSVYVNTCTNPSQSFLSQMSPNPLNLGMVVGEHTDLIHRQAISDQQLNLRTCVHVTVYVGKDNYSINHGYCDSWASSNCTRVKRIMLFTSFPPKKYMKAHEGTGFVCCFTHCFTCRSHTAWRKQFLSLTVSTQR